MNESSKISPREQVRQENVSQLAAKARARIAAEIRKRRKLIANLNSDLEKHGDPDMWKRYGDLILANLNTAKRQGDKIFVTDYFDDAAPVVEVAGKNNLSLNEVAEDYFRSYAKARNGRRVIAERIMATESAIAEALLLLARVDEAEKDLDEEFLFQLNEPKRRFTVTPRKKKVEQGFKGARRFVSSDGFEILVGKKAKDNDYLTFRIARSLDLWLHAADYPGSHVVIRSSGKKTVPDRTLVEAAELAAFYSDAREQPKAAVRYTQKKFVNKPKRSAPGLVSLASFKTVLVEPKVGIELIRDERQ